ncbi:MAG: Glutaredoxin-like protein, YruB-family [candidate division WWE3 bacterium GW2011_GWF2_41_45]|uniref:Glutaredoxin-like protein, YruB-family n=3 Tax=Katanobacteria TaxID=422282 RepID=A0A0G0VNX7_UNCKA|nr:MAG: Glutaredoxin-like protein, YruB-family [candidate division WWE3 bacterium GW2011_GWC2_41_23]KKS09936.1 MAG: Glutaredoxin-like protein, YruB-family [candidate division WWE3 bacterium GW2011_GWF2_41_45]KKS11913.1 MAG: Glutaredoxin-like protein, YruB-family [candidate division WWE3 bacterium GW2011_GWF1_41_53]KKS19582.1 MAG: Glutaredoxin-like protein, YruB-family [candidate division WWE3 bacterium GW2011_GWE1_41_72]KKS28115.1 MAG: Glutaredoxin-like protein, YruB-family [candidate division 
MNIAYYRKSKFDFDKTLSNLLDKAKDLGFEVVSQTKLDENLGLIVTIKDRDLTQKILTADSNLIGLIPTSVAVLNKNGVLVGIGNPELMSGVTPNHEIQHYASELATKMKTLINETTGVGELKVVNVKLYSTHTCPYCKMEKDWLEKNMVKHETVYLEEAPKEAEYVVKSTGQMGVPVTEIIYEDNESEFVIGFDRDKLASMLVK